MKNVKKRVGIVCMVLCMVMFLCSCGKSYKMEDYVGTYVGQAGTVLILKENGECLYNTRRNTSWNIEDDRIVIDTGVCEIYAELDDNSPLLLLFQSDSSRWNDELFVKAIE